MMGPIGVFDSGYGGLTVLRELVRRLPEYDYLYLGDNARTPYGTRSFETVYAYTWECVKVLFANGCPLVILACNTASAKALVNIQRLDLPRMAPDRRVLGVIRPTAEKLDSVTRTGHVGILGTQGTVLSDSYPREIKRVAPRIRVYQEACPIWVPLIENQEYDTPGAEYFIRRHLDRLLAQSPLIDTVVLGCTHYPILLEQIRKWIPPSITVVAQGELVADRLADYLERHPEIQSRLTTGRARRFLTTETSASFNPQASRFFGSEVRAEGHQ